MAQSMLHLPGSCAAARMLFLRRFASDELPKTPMLGAGTRNGIKARLRSCTQSVVGLQWCDFVISKSAMPSRVAPGALMSNSALLQTCHWGSAVVQSC